MVKIYKTLQVNKDFGVKKITVAYPNLNKSNQAHMSLSTLYRILLTVKNFLKNLQPLLKLERILFCPLIGLEFID